MTTSTGATSGFYPSRGDERPEGKVTGQRLVGMGWGSGFCSSPAVVLRCRSEGVWPRILWVMGMFHRCGREPGLCLGRHGMAQLFRSRDDQAELWVGQLDHVLSHVQVFGPGVGGHRRESSQVDLLF